jgi:hypothetical protein
MPVTKAAGQINNLDQKLKAIALLIGLPHLAVFG